MYKIVSSHEDPSQFSRRRFFERLSGAASLTLLPALGSAVAGPLSEAAGGAGEEAAGAALPTGERYWALVKSQFILRDGLILMNAANLCPAPAPVLEAVYGGLRDEDEDASMQNRSKYAGAREVSRTKLAQLLGASPDEIAIVRNTTEANNTVVRAIDLKPGDEVLLWDENHPTNNVAWKVRAAREGLKVNFVSVPWPAKSPEQILEIFRQGATPRTKILSFSHVSNHSGTAIPAKELCAWAHERGMIVHLDGAQTFGVKHVNLHEIGCDSYSGSAHKWFMGPKEAGILYVRQERVNDYRAAIVGAGWGDDVDSTAMGARKFECFGQRNDATLAAVGVSVNFHNSIGEPTIEARVHELAAALKEGINKIPGSHMFTPNDPGLSLGVVFFDLGNDVDHDKAYQRLYEQVGLGCAIFKGPHPKLRICPHIYNTMAEVDRVVGALHAIATSG